MDGIHDMGGMHGYGPVIVERDEPVFHARWEGRVLGLQGATGGSFVSNIDKFRHAIERMRPAEYLTAGYYGRWLRAIETRLVEAGELEAGEVDRRARELAERGGGSKTTTANEATEGPAHEAASTRGDVSSAASTESAPPVVRPPRSRYRREVDRPPLYQPGDAIRTRNIHPAGHTRFPRYVRGRRGRIESLYAAYVYPDTHAHDLGEDPQHLYCVSFDGAELWGADAEPGTRVYIDLFEPYLERP